MHVATALGTAELPLKRTNALMDKLWVTMKNTARWRLTTGILNSFIGGLQQAFGYAKSLNASLNDIRIVSGKSTDEMARFAKEANRAAQALSTTTTTYTDASLIYYQQGLNDDEVKKRTDATIKMANVTGQTAETISQQMTAVWNNFYDGTRSLESFEDAMVALGASTATSSKEIAEGLEKFAPVANTVGLSFDYAAAALATITATTRESASVAGNALKTLFSRLEGLKLGETLDDGTDLNKYSQALYSVGINIKDVSGELKDMDTILDELGARWQTLARDQQMALAETVGGVRQYAQLVALMDNWDFFQQNLMTARGSEGALDKQAQIYAESWEAARDRIKAATEDVYDSLINPQIFIDLDNMARPILKTFASMLDAIGGLTGLLPILSALMFKVYGNQMANSLRDIAINIGLITGQEQERVRSLQAEAALLVNRLSLVEDDQTADGLKNQILADRIKIQGEINKVADKLTVEQQAQIKNELAVLELLEQEQVKRAEIAEKANVKREEITQDYLGINIPTSSKDPGWSSIKNELNTTLKDIEKVYGQAGAESANGFVQNFADMLSRKKGTIFADIQKFPVPVQIKAIFNIADLEYQKIQQELARLQPLNEILDTQNVSSEQIKQVAVALGEMDEQTELTEEQVESFKDKIASLTAQANAVLNIFKVLGAQDGPLGEYKDAVRDGAVAQEHAAVLDEARGKSLDAVRIKLQAFAKASEDWAANMVKIGSSLSTMAMGMRSVDNIFRILKDSSLDAGAVITQSLTSTAMLLPVVASGISSLGKVITGTALSVQTAMPIVAAIGVVLFTVYKTIDAFIVSQKEAQDIIKESTKVYQEAKDELQSLQNELETTQDRIRELQELAETGSISIVEQEELNNLQLENDRLERQISLKEKLLKLKLEDTVSDIEKNINKTYKIKDFSGYSAYNDIKDEFVRNKDILVKDFAQMWEAQAELYKDLELIPKELSETDTNSAYKSIMSHLGIVYQNLGSWSIDQAFDELNSADVYWDKLLNGDKEKVYEYVNALYNELAIAEQSAYDRYLADNEGIYSQIEQDYTTFIDAINLGIRSINDQDFINLTDQLVKLRHAFYPDESEYAKTFLDPILTQLNDNDLNALLKSSFETISEQGRKLLLQYGTYEEELASRIQEVTKNAVLELNKFGLGSLAQNYTYTELKLIAEKSEGFQSFEELFNYLQANAGVISVSLEVQAIEDARTEALATLASGEMLNEETITKIQEAYQNIIDLSDFGVWSIQHQIDFLKTEGKLAEQQIEEQEQRLQNLKKNKSDLEEFYSNGLKIGGSTSFIFDKQTGDSFLAGIDTAIKETEKELQSLKNRFEKDSWKITIEESNITAATLNNLKKALALVNEDLTVSAENVAELGKRYPEALVNATYDADQNILQLEAAKYDQLKTLLEENIDINRDAQAAKLTNIAESEAEALAIIKFIEQQKQGEYFDTLTTAEGYDDEKLDSARKAAAAALADILQKEIDTRRAYLETSINQQASSKAATDTLAENAEIIAENYSTAASEILRSFDTMFQRIAEGVQRMINSPGEYVSIWRGGIKSGLSAKSGTAGSLYTGDLNNIRNSDEYQAANAALNSAQEFVNELQKFVQGSKDALAWDKLYGTLSEDAKGLLTDDIRQAVDNLFATEGAEGVQTFFEEIAKDPSTVKSIEESYQEILDALWPLLEKTNGEKTKKGSGGKSSGNLKEEEAKEFKEELERYHEITREIEYQERALKKLETQINRTYGLDRLKLYEKQIKELTKLAELQEQKAKEAAGYVGIDLANLTSLGLKPQQNKDTLNLDNYTQLLKDSQEEYKEALEEYNNWLATVWNAAETKEEQEALEATKEAQNDLLEKAKELYDDRIEALKKYEESVDTYLDQKEKVDEALRNIEDAKLNSITYRMEVILDVREARKQIRDFTKEIAQSFGDALTHGAEEAKLGWEQAKDEMAMYKEYVQEYNDLKALLDNANEYTDTTAIIDELKNLEGNIIESGQRLLEWADYVENMFVEALSAASERFKRFTDQLAHDTNILGTIKELYTLQGITYKVEGGFAQLMQTAEGQYQGYLRQAQLNKEWYEDRAAQLAQAEAALQGVLETDIRYDTLKKNRDALLAEANEAQQAMLDNAKSAMEVAKQMYLDQIEKMAYELEKRITGGSGFDLLQDKYDHYLEENDRYLDNIEESLETSIWYTRLQQDIDKTGNNAYKERLKRLQEEIDLRREGNTLSKYDLDILEAKYKVLQAQAALEDAQNNKSKVRLVRDSNGNWNYQFTADQSDIGTQEEELLKAKQNEYEITKQRYKDLNDEMIRMAEEFAEKDRQIREDMANGILTEEEGQARLAELKRYYEEKANYLSTELNIAKRDMTEAAITSATLSAGLTESVYNSSNELIQTIVNTFKNTHSPQLLSAASTTLSELQIALGAHISEFVDASDEIKASIAKIIGTETSDGQDINGLVQRLNTSIPEIAAKLAGWKDVFSDAIDPITIALQSIIEGGDIKGISANQLPQYLQDIAEGSLYDVLMGDGDNSYSGLAHGVANNFTEQFDSIIGVIEENFIPAVEKHMPEAAKAFEDFTQKIEDTANAIGVGPNNLSDMTNELTNDIQRMYDEGYEAINVLEQQLWATYDLQAGYLELAQSVWEYIYALQALAANQVVPTIEAASGIDTFGDTSNEKEKLPYTGDLSQKMAAALYNEDLGSYTTFQNQRQVAEDQFGTDIVGSTDEIDRKLKNMTDDQLERIATGVEYIDTTLTKEHAQDVYDFTGSPTIHIASGATGMYTGEFDGGKLGILHEKELLLNAEDTQNILSAVSAVRGISDVLFGNIADRLDSDGLAAMAMLGSRIGGISLPGPADSSLEQHVIIESVSFPGVTSSREIEEAFENLVNDAAQWARRRKS